MTNLEAWLLSYLLNSLWQVPLIFSVAWVAARVLRVGGAAMEHRVWVCALVAEAFLPGCSAPASGWLRSWNLLSREGEAAVNGTVSVVVGPGVGVGSFHLSATLLAWSATTFFGVIVYFAARLAWRLRKTWLLERGARPFAMSAEAKGFWERCRVQFGVDHARVGMSDAVLGPVTLGVRGKLVLIPVTMTDTLRGEDLHTVLAHEFAHMQRHDYVKNLVYELLALSVSYHPLCWVTRQRLIETREEVCDQLAAEAVAGRARYARSLLRLASLLVQGRTARVPHAIGIFDANGFERRIMRLTRKNEQVEGVRRVALLGVCGALALGTCVSALALRTEIAVPGASGSAAATEKVASGEQDPTKVSAGVMAGQILSKVVPVYPLDAKQAHIQGAVVLRATIGADGLIQNLTVISGPEMLQQSALDAVKQWVYKPYLLNGNPTSVETTITVTYSFAN